MESGTIVRWFKAEGDTVEKGEVLYELDTEKATQEVEAEASGVLLKILAGEGEEIEVGRRSPSSARRARRSSEERAEGRSEGGRPRSERAEGRGRPGREREDEREPGREALQLGREAREGGGRARSAAQRRPRQGLAARAADRARTGHRPGRAHRHRPRGPHRRRGRRARREGGRADRRRPRCGSSGAALRSRSRSSRSPACARRSPAA